MYNILKYYYCNIARQYQINVGKAISLYSEDASGQDI